MQLMQEIRMVTTLQADIRQKEVPNIPYGKEIINGRE